MTSEPVESVAEAEAEQHHVSAEEGAATAVNQIMTQEEIEAARAEQGAPPEMTGGSVIPPAPPVQTPFMTAAGVENAGQVTGGWTNPGPYMQTVEQQQQQAAAEKARREAAGEPEPEPQPEAEAAPAPDPLSIQPGADYIGAQQQAGELPPSPKPDSTIEEMQASPEAEPETEAEAEGNPSPPPVEVAPETPKEPAAPPAGAEPSSSF